MILRKLGNLVLGKATPFQIYSAAVLGGAAGFMPGPRAAGSIVALLLVLVILNANLFVAAVVGLLAKLLSLPLLPASFAAGRVLVDGPTQGLFAWLINAPVTALLGLEYYAVTGGLVLGALVGVAAAWPIVRGLRFVRTRLADLEEHSERYQKLMGRWWVRPLMFVLLGARKGRRTYRELLERRVGLPVRPLGVVFALLVVGILVLVGLFANEPVVTWALQRGLERANGATVDVQSARLDLSENRLVLSGLAMADPNDLETDLIRAAEVEGDVGGLDLLRKRLVLDRVTLRDARHGAKRAVPGRHVGRPPRAPEPGEGIVIPDAEKLEEYLETARRWKERLAQVRRWLEKLGGTPDEGDEETVAERVARQVRELGYARARADHLIEGAPTLLVRELLAAGMQSSKLPEGETLDLHGRNLSTHPSRHPEPPRVEVRSSRGTFEAVADLAGAVDPARSSDLSVQLRGVPVSAVVGQWRGGAAPMSGGTIDLDTRFAWASGPGAAIDFPLQLTLHDTTITVPGAGSRQVKRFALPVRVLGSLADPAIQVDGDTIARSLADAGAAELAEKARTRVDDEIKKATDKLGEKAGGILGDLLGGDKKKKDG